MPLSFEGIRGLFEEGKSSKALALAEEAVEEATKSGEAKVRVKALHLVSDVHRACRMWGKAVTSVQEACKVARESGDKRLHAEALVVAANTLSVPGSGNDQANPAQALEHAKEAQQIYGELSEATDECSTLEVVVNLHIQIDAADAGVAAAKAAQASFKKKKHTHGEATALLHVGRAHLAKDQPDEALAAADAALALLERQGGMASARVEALTLKVDAMNAQGNGDVMNVAYELRALAVKESGMTIVAKAALAVSGAYFTSGKMDEAFRFAGDALVLSQRSGNASCEAQAQMQVARIATKTNPRQASMAASAAVQYYRDVGDKRCLAAALRELATAGLSIPTQTIDAAVAAHEASALYGALGNKTEQGRALHQEGSALLKGNQLDEALAVAEQAREIANETGSKEDEARALSLIGSTCLHKQETHEALLQLKVALRTYKDLNHAEGMNSVRHTLEKVQEATRVGFAAPVPPPLTYDAPIVSLNAALAPKAYNSIIWAQALHDGIMTQWNVDFCIFIVELAKADRKTPIVVVTRGAYSRQMGEIAPSTQTDFSAISLWGVVRTARMEFPMLNFFLLDVSIQTLAADICRGTTMLQFVPEIIANSHGVSKVVYELPVVARVSNVK